MRNILSTKKGEALPVTLNDQGIIYEYKTLDDIYGTADDVEPDWLLFRRSENTAYD